MKTLTGRLRIFAEPGSPTVAMTATATDMEISSMISNLGLRTAPVILKASPVQSHIKFVMLNRPSNNCGSYGRIDKWGNEHPGLIALLRRIYLDMFIKNTRLNLPTSKCLMLFRTESHMFDVNDYIGSELRHLKGKYVAKWQLQPPQPTPLSNHFIQCQQNWCPNMGIWF